MTKIVLVDSDASALSKTAQAVKALRGDWQITQASDGKSAQAYLQDNTTDCLITEAQLSDMSGFELLNYIQGYYPDTVRLTLSADLDQEVVLESARANHRFIDKTVSSAVLVAAIECSVKLQNVLSNDRLIAQMRTIQSLPALPVIYREMMDELSASHSSLLNVGQIIEQDMGLTATVLKIVNSSFYGLNQRVESVAQGVALLGVHLIKNITLTAKVFSQFEGSGVGLQRLKQLNDDACKVGAIANQFARNAKISKSAVDHSQIAGMMCNIGELVAIVAMHDNPGQQSESSTELLGAYLLRVWQLPDAVVEAVAMQQEIPEKNCEAITPSLVIHAIRYLQEHFQQATDQQQYENCFAYFTQFMSQNIAESWLRSYQDISLLTGHTDKAQIRAA